MDFYLCTPLRKTGTKVTGKRRGKVLKTVSDWVKKKLKFFQNKFCQMKLTTYLCTPLANELNGKLTKSSLEINKAGKAERAARMVQGH